MAALPSTCGQHVRVAEGGIEGSDAFPDGGRPAEPSAGERGGGTVGHHSRAEGGERFGVRGQHREYHERLAEDGPQPADGLSGRQVASRGLTVPQLCQGGGGLVPETVGSLFALVDRLVSLAGRVPHRRRCSAGDPEQIGREQCSAQRGRVGRAAVVGLLIGGQQRRRRPVIASSNAVAAALARPGRSTSSTAVVGEPPGAARSAGCSGRARVITARSARADLERLDQAELLRRPSVSALEDQLQCRVLRSGRPFGLDQRGEPQLQR